MENTIVELLISYPTFAFSWHPNITQGFVLWDDKHNGSLFSLCGIKTCQPLQETTSCYLQTTPSILLSSVIMCATMHGSSILPFHISCTTKRQHIRLFAQYWHTQLLEHPGWHIFTLYATNLFLASCHRIILSFHPLLTSENVDECSFNYQILI